MAVKKEIRTSRERKSGPRLKGKDPVPRKELAAPEVPELMPVTVAKEEIDFPAINRNANRILASIAMLRINVEQVPE